MLKGLKEKKNEDREQDTTQHETRCSKNNKVTQNKNNIPVVLMVSYVGSIVFVFAI